MADWTDLSGVFTFGSQLTSVQQQNLRDNVVFTVDLSHGNTVMVIPEAIEEPAMSWTEFYDFSFYKTDSTKELYLRVKGYGLALGMSRMRFYDTSDTLVYTSVDTYSSGVSQYDQVIDVSTFDHGWHYMNVALYNAAIESMAGAWNVSSV